MSSKEKKDKSKATSKSSKKTKKVSLEEFKMKSFVSPVKVDQMQFLKTAGG